MSAGAGSSTAPGSHKAVLREEAVSALAIGMGGVYVDATFGRGGHSGEILARMDSAARLLALDRDPEAVAVGANIADPRFRIFHAGFGRLREVLEGAGVQKVNGVLLDLGVSSPQLDQAERGFSFRHDGPLDMRMDPDAPLSAAEVINAYPVPELARVIGRYGDERFAGRIAAAIAAARPITGTARLADVVVGAIPHAARRTGGHPATRTFQAIRIEVNGELVILGPALDAALGLLAVGGRGMVLTYHSGEDRIVKDVFRRHSTLTAPPRLPVAPPEPPYATIRPLARRPRPEEVEANPRSASARLRSIERVAA